MKRNFEWKSLLKNAVVICLAVVATWAVMSSTSSGQKKGSTLAAIGLDDFVKSEITYDGVMHELYWHYEFANQMIRVGRIVDAKAHLRVMNFYVNILPYMHSLRDKRIFNNQESAKKFDSYAINLLKVIDRIYADLGKKNPAELGKQLEKNVSAMCHHCHDVLRDNVREVTPYGKKIVL